MNKFQKVQRSLGGVTTKRETRLQILLHTGWSLKGGRLLFRVKNMSSTKKPSLIYKAGELRSLLMKSDEKTEKGARQRARRKRPRHRESHQRRGCLRLGLNLPGTQRQYRVPRGSQSEKRRGTFPNGTLRGPLSWG